MNTENNIKVSIVIVCMNNLKNLYPCLESIRKYTHVSYETFVVAYLFTPENLERVKADFPWATFIESNEIRGFSENNNLALRQACGEYCFVVNDDTILREGCIDKLVDAFHQLPDKVAIVSPNVFDGNGKLTVSGNPPIRWYDHLLFFLRLKKRYTGNRWVMGQGLFQSYNILGAAFMIKTDVFRAVGWFDEYYFFAPEDIALSSLLNRKGYECWVNTDSEIVHLEGMTGGKSVSMIKTATGPAAQKGSIHCYSDGKWYLYILLTLIFLSCNTIQMSYHFIEWLYNKDAKRYYVLAVANWHSIKALFSEKKPKELFIEYYTKLKIN